MDYSFLSFFRKLRKQGLWEITPSVLEKIWTINGLKAPDVERIVDVKERISYITYVNNYALTVHTDINRITKDFSGHGMITIVIERMTDRGSESLLFRFIYKKGDNGQLEKIIEYVKFILEELRQRWPLTSKGNLAQLKEFRGEKFYWVDENEKKIRNFFHYCGTYPLVDQGEKQRVYYHKVVRKRLGIKKYRRQIRKKYAKKK
jgi:hypothetical protein